MFAKIARIVTRWYGNPTDKSVLPQLFEDAILAWKSGIFEGKKVFPAADPGGQTFIAAESVETVEAFRDDNRHTSEHPNAAAHDSAGIRVDLSRIGIGP